MENKIVIMEVKREGNYWLETSIYSVWTMYLFFNKNFPTKIVGFVGEQEVPITTIKKNNQIVWAIKDQQEIIEPDKIVIYREMI